MAFWKRPDVVAALERFNAEEGRRSQVELLEELFLLTGQRTSQPTLSRKLRGLCPNGKSGRPQKRQATADSTLGEPPTKQAKKPSDSPSVPQQQQQASASSPGIPSPTPLAPQNAQTRIKSTLLGKRKNSPSVPQEQPQPASAFPSSDIPSCTPLAPQNAQTRIKSTLLGKRKKPPWILPISLGDMPSVDDALAMPNHIVVNGRLYNRVGVTFYRPPGHFVAVINCDNIPYFYDGLLTRLVEFDKSTMLRNGNRYIPQVAVYLLCP